MGLREMWTALRCRAPHYTVINVSSLHLLSKKTSCCCTFYSQMFNESFVFSDKSRSCSGAFAIYIAVSKEYLTLRQIIFSDI